MKAILAVIIIVTLAGCQNIKITDPKTGIVFSKTTVLMKEGARDIEVKDGDRSVNIKASANDQTVLAAQLIALGQSLANTPK